MVMVLTDLQVRLLTFRIVQIRFVLDKVWKIVCLKERNVQNSNCHCIYICLICMHYTVITVTDASKCFFFF